MKKSHFEQRWQKSKYQQKEKENLKSVYFISNQKQYIGLWLKTVQKGRRGHSTSSDSYLQSTKLLKIFVPMLTLLHDYKNQCLNQARRGLYKLDIGCTLIANQISGLVCRRVTGLICLVVVIRSVRGLFVVANPLQ